MRKLNNNIEITSNLKQTIETFLNGHFGTN